MQLAPRILDQDAQPHIWTRSEYHQISATGVFLNQRVQLIEGQVIDMSPMNSAHAITIDKVADVLRQVFGSSYYIRQQKPLVINDISEPEPDVAVILGSLEDYSQAHPTTALLVVEVSDSTLRFDRRVKGKLYAKAQLQDYWILNLVDRQLEVYRRPELDPEDPGQWYYAERVIDQAEDRVTPIALPDHRIGVKDLLPRKTLA